jgi:hypothetical protein
MKSIVSALLLLALPAFASASVDLSEDFSRATGAASAPAFLSQVVDQWDGASAFPPIVKQSPLGACQSFALTAFMEYAFYRRTGQVVDFSEKATSYALLRYMIDEFHDPATDSYPDGLFRGRPELGSGVGVYMIESLLQSGLWPNNVYSFGSLDAAEGAVNLDIPLYMQVFEEAKTALKKEEYLTKIDEVFFAPPPARFVFKVPYLDFATGKAAVWEGHTPAEMLALAQVKKESFAVYHNQDLNAFFQPQWNEHKDIIVKGLAEATRAKGIKEETLSTADLKQKIISSLERRMVVMVASSVWIGSWKDKDRVYQAGGGHAMVIVGYQKLGDRLFFKLRNSWGTEIGQEGYNIVEDTVLLPNLLEVTVLE